LRFVIANGEVLIPNGSLGTTLGFGDAVGALQELATVVGIWVVGGRASFPGRAHVEKVLFNGAAFFVLTQGRR